MRVVAKATMQGCLTSIELNGQVSDIDGNKPSIVGVTSDLVLGVFESQTFIDFSLFSTDMFHLHRQTITQSINQVCTSPAPSVCLLLHYVINGPVTAP